MECEILPKKGSNRRHFITFCIHGKHTTASFQSLRCLKRVDCCCAEFVNAKKEKTVSLRYGVKHVMHHPPFYAKNKRSAYEKKLYTWPSGKVTTFMGYEKWLYEVLLAGGVPESAMITDAADMVHFPYTNSKLTPAVYFPDLQIANVVFEVKSQFTYDSDENITRKVDAVIAGGYIFELWIF